MSRINKHRQALSILLFLQAPLFAWHVVIVLASPDARVAPVASTAIDVLADSLGAALVVILGIFVWRGSSIAVIASVVGSVIEIVLVAVPLGGLFLLFGSGLLVPVMAGYQPVMALGALAILILILGVSLRAKENSEAGSASR
jgi:hypothetical protein